MAFNPPPPPGSSPPYWGRASFSGEAALPARPEAATARTWKCMCEGCGAPLQRAELRCSYCLRDTMVEADLIEITTLSDRTPRYVAR